MKVKIKQEEHFENEFNGNFAVEIGFMCKAMKAYKDDAGGKQGVKGVMKCPKCGGDLHCVF